jgi:two-component system, OmpR family, phosphate regulon sensor histidine kinase PhoR
VIVALALVSLVAVGIAVAAVVAVRRARAWQARARAEAAEAAGAVAVAERRARAALQDLPFVALRIDREGRLVDSNIAALESFPFLTPGMSVLETFSEHLLAQRVEAALATLESQRFEVRLFADGRRTYRAAVEPYEVGDVREALLFLADASEAVAYQELRSQFVANVSHELRTPLTGLRGLLEALGDPGMDPATRRDFVARASGETQRLEALISDILFLSELEATQGLPATTSSDLSQAVSSVAAELAGMAAEYGVALEVDLPGPAWTPLTERMAHTVVRNLVENALKYAGPGARAVASVTLAGDGVVLRVTDDGAGIPERHLNHVFERFYRADPSRSKRLGGTGLGLSIVKHISERFAGRATASSREGFGTTITVSLPGAPPPPEEDHEDPSRLGRPSGDRASSPG